MSGLLAGPCLTGTLSKSRSRSCSNDAELAAKISDPQELATLVSDYVAGMTDRYAIKEFEELI